MRLVSFRPPPDAKRTLGVLLDDQTVLALPGQMEHLLIEGQKALEGVRERIAHQAGTPELPDPIPLSQVVMDKPVLARSIRDFIAFEDHAKAGAARRGEELAPVWYERPIYYKGNPHTIIGPDRDIPKPSFTSALDFELEVAAIVSGPLIDADDDQAAASIFGFTIMNDFSARDVQGIEMAARLGPAKSKDFATSIGPCILTADEVGPQPALDMTARVNGRTVAKANLGEAFWTFAKMISFVSQGERLVSGELFGSGTPFKGCILDQGTEAWLQPGDVVELEVDKIGILRNKIA